MPADGVSLTDARRLLSAEELLRLAALFVRAGVDKIRLTGGEPTVRPDLAAVVGEITTLLGPWLKGGVLSPH